jgi:hypothetical protein
MATYVEELTPIAPEAVRAKYLVERDNGLIEGGAVTGQATMLTPRVSRPR